MRFALLFKQSILFDNVYCFQKSIDALLKDDILYKLRIYTLPLFKCVCLERK